MYLADELADVALFSDSQELSSLPRSIPGGPSVELKTALEALESSLETASIEKRACLRGLAGELSCALKLVLQVKVIHMGRAYSQELHLSS